MSRLGRTARWSDWLVVGAIACATTVAGCGGSPGITPVVDASPDGTNPGLEGGAPDASANGPDAGATAEASSGDDGSTQTDGGGTTPDSGNSGEASAGSEGGESGAEGGGDAATCGADDTACMGGTGPGLCIGGACSACVDTTDDMNCTTAYGNPELCLGGVCAPGNCRQNSDCASNAAGTLCGASTPNQCGKCTNDSQCAAASGSTPVCNTGTGQCVAGTCPVDAGVAGNPPAACPVNASDMCCAIACQPNPSPGASSKACCGTGALANTYCTGLIGAGATCANNVCTLCGAPTAGALAVDPMNGSDSTGTGANTAGCALKTITRALQIIGTGSVIQNTVTILTGTVGAGETFPIVVPQNVNITTSTGAVTVNVPAGKSGFLLSAGASGVGTVAGINGGSGALAISGQSHTATYGIVASAGSAQSTQISNLTVSGFLDDGILVENTGILTIGAGVTSTDNGTTAGRHDGLHVTGSGHAFITVPSGQTPTHFDANTNHGILVDGSGYVTVSGSIISASAGTGTVTANQNYAAGLWMEQTPGTPPQNVITGLVSFANTAGNGLRLVAGSNVKVRGSVSLSNAASGVIVSTGGTAKGPSNDISKIDLGNETGPDYGNNTFQAPLSATPNGSAGICLQVKPASGTLLAAGNTFSAANCATAASALTANKTGCANNVAACASGVCDLGIVGAGNNVDVKMCTYP